MINLFILLNVVILITGFYCSYKLCGSRPFWVRMIVLSPTFAAFYGIYVATQTDYTVYGHDILVEISLMFLYALVASSFSGTPWLDLKASKRPLCK
jgi:hypothetical protein